MKQNDRFKTNLLLKYLCARNYKMKFSILDKRAKIQTWLGAFVIIIFLKRVKFWKFYTKCIIIGPFLNEIWYFEKSDLFYKSRFPSKIRQKLISVMGMYQQIQGKVTATDQMWWLTRDDRLVFVVPCPLCSVDPSPPDFIQLQAPAGRKQVEHTTLI